jgi:sugar lactone lactonase YvrE
MHAVRAEVVADVDNISSVGMAVDGNGNVYIADTSNGCIRVVDPDDIITSYWCAVG